MTQKKFLTAVFLILMLTLNTPYMATAHDAQYQIYNLTIQPGADETELNFTWFTEDPTYIPQLIVCPEEALEGENIPETADRFSGEIEIVVVESGASGGPGGPGGPGGGPPDADSDGVFDMADQCPDTPEGVTVNENGCADTDEDGVGDYEDLCPETPVGTVVDETGCPLENDGDGDGVLDDADECVDTPLGTTVAGNGCPDSDGDGVPDDEDQCPETSSGEDVDETGCVPTIYACKVSMTGVQQNMTYVYAVSNGATDNEIFSEMYSFGTQNSENYSFVFVGDPQIGASRDTDSDSAGWANTVTNALTAFENTSFILSAGDQVEKSTSDSQYDGFFSASELTSVPFAPTIGNHDTSELYAYHFNVSNESELGTTDGGGDYWFVYNNTLFMMLNTNNSSALSHSEFMKQAIEANPAAVWRVVVFHHSLYSSARHVDDVDDLRTSLVPVMDEHDIDIVLAGHDHFYARTYPLFNFGVSGDNSNVDEHGRVEDPIGTVYFTACSASGSKYYDFTEIEGYTNYYLAAYSQPNEPSYLNVEVTTEDIGDTFTVTAYLTESGEAIDTYTILKRNYDLNGDGTVNREDVSVIRSLLRQPASANPAADIDNDGQITIQDARKLIIIISEKS